jgi:long-chain acyl-CoA synthetase
MDPTISWTLDRAATTNGNGESTIDLGTGERRTWSETKERVASLSSAIAELAVDRGDRVGVLMLNSARHLELWFAIPGAGMVLNDLNYRLAPEELRFICEDSQVKVLFVDDMFLELGRTLLSSVEALTTLVWTGPGSDAPEGTVAYEALVDTTPSDLPAAKGDDLAAIFYTGGTTGLPKGAMLSHRNLTTNAMHMIAAAQITPRDRYLHAGPQFHLADGAMTYSLTWAGGSHVFIPAFDPTATVSALVDEHVTMSLLVPTMITMTLASGGLEGADLGALRLLIYGASPMPASVQREAMEKFGCGMAQAYGMTEAAPLVTWLDETTHRLGAAGEEPHAGRLRSAGTPIVGVRTEVRRADGSVAAEGEAGEIYIQGPNIMSGYWNRPDESEHALVEGWYRSGDVAYADADGFLFVVDRAKDMIISGGENIYTSEVENAVYTHPAVAEAAVFGIPHDDWGETVHVEVVTKPGAELTSDELIEHCRTKIAGYKLPRSVKVRPADEVLPKSGAGKILKRDLRAPYWEGHEKNVG